MTIQLINIGSGELTGDGESLRSAFNKSNQNFQELFSLTNFNSVASNIIPTADLTYDLGSTSSQWRSLYVGTSTIYLGGTALTVGVNGELLVNGTSVVEGVGGNPFDQDLNSTDSPNFANLGLAGTLESGYATLAITINRDFVIGLDDIGLGPKVFEFNRDGTLSLPGWLEVKGIIRNTSPNFDLSISGDQGEAAASLYLPLDANATTTSAGLYNMAGDIELVTKNGDNPENIWLFNRDGNITVPDASGISGLNSITVPLNESLTVNLSRQLGLDPLTQSSISIRPSELKSSNFYIGLSTVNDHSIDLLEDEKQVNIGVISSGEHIRIRYGTATPGGLANGSAQIDAGTWAAGLESSVYLTAQNNTWQFRGEDAAIVFPDTTVQTTAYTRGLTTFEIDATTTATTGLLGADTIIITPAVGYSGSDEQTLEFTGRDVAGMRTLLINSSSLCVVNFDFVSMDFGPIIVQPSTVMEVIYVGNNTWYIISERSM